LFSSQRAKTSKPSSQTIIVAPNGCDNWARREAAVAIYWGFCCGVLGV
jgi:hypothetical protein